MMIQHKAIVGLAACVMLCGMNDSIGGVTESSADTAPSDWSRPVMGFDAGDDDLRGTGIRIMLGGTETGISVDLLSQSDHSNGWGVLGPDSRAVLEKDKPWTILDLPRGDKAQGSSYVPGWDVASWIDLVLDAGLTNSNFSSAWNPGSLANDGIDFDRDNVYLDNIAAIPEPATYGLITIFGGGLLLFRRRFKL